MEKNILLYPNYFLLRDYVFNKFVWESVKAKKGFSIMTGKNLHMTVCVPLCKLLTLLLIAVLFLALPTSPHAVEITYTGDGKDLRDSPTWFSEETDFSLFPDSEKASLPSGNSVIIDYDPSAVGVTNPKIVFGGLDALKSTAGNRVVLINGRVEDVIFGGLSYKAVSENNIVTILGGSVAEDVIGGFSVSGVALRNIVIVSGGSVGDYVYGGAGEEGAAGNSRRFG